jgi:hypothetical protein
MDFFDRQQRARKHTKLLEVYFGLAVFGISSGIYFAVVLFLNWWGISGHRHYDYGFQQTCGLWDAQLFLTVAAITLVFILCGSAYKIVRLFRGGKVVAEMLGDRFITADTSDPNERPHADLSAPGTKGSVRPDLHHPGGDAGWCTGQAHIGEHGQGTHDMRLLLSGGRPDPVFVHARGEPGMSYEAGLFARVRLADLRHIRQSTPRNPTEAICGP